MRETILFIVVAGFVSMVAASAFAQYAVPSRGDLGRVVSAKEAHSKAQSGEIVLVDIRTPEEWTETGIPANAKAITMREGDPAFHAALAAAVGNDRSRPLALICRTGNRSTRILAELRQAGFTNLLNVAEGVAGGPHGEGWLKAGLPTRAGTRP